MRSGRAPNGPAGPGAPPPPGLGRDPQPQGYIPTPIRSPRFSNYPAAVPGPPAALRAALLSPEKCQGRNTRRGGEGRKEIVPWDFVELLGVSGRPVVLFHPEGTVTGGEGM